MTTQTTNGPVTAAVEAVTQSAAASTAPEVPEMTRRPRGEARRRALQKAPAVTMVSEAAYLGSRYRKTLRYGALNAADLEAIARAAAPAPAVAAPVVVDLVGAPAASRRSVQRDRVARSGPRVALSHKVAAAAAVSGLALTAAWPQLNGAEEEAQTEQASAALAQVADVVVAEDVPYEFQLASVTGSYTKDDHLEQIMTAAEGDVTRVETAGVLSQPLDRVRITSRFGYRADPWGGGGTVNHIGQDYGAQCGTPVKAAAAGTVVQAQYAGHSGNRVRIDHGNGLETTYNHNSSLRVSVGQKVSRGDVVALSGTTGNSTGCHLHFEVLVNGTAVDPAGWL